MTRDNRSGNDLFSDSTKMRDFPQKFVYSASTGFAGQLTDGLFPHFHLQLQTTVSGNAKPDQGPFSCVLTIPKPVVWAMTARLSCLNHTNGNNLVTGSEFS